MLTPFIHLWLALAGLLFDRFRDSPIPYSSSLHSCISISVSVSDLSRLCEGKGFSVGDGCLKSDENETHKRTRRCIYKHTQAYARTHTLTNAHTSLVRQWCDGQHWHLAGGTIRWWKKSRREKASDAIERGKDGER